MLFIITVVSSTRAVFYARISTVRPTAHCAKRVTTPLIMGKRNTLDGSAASTANLRHSAPDFVFRVGDRKRQVPCTVGRHRPHVAKDIYLRAALPYDTGSLQAVARREPRKPCSVQQADLTIYSSSPRPPFIRLCLTCTFRCVASTPIGHSLYLSRIQWLFESTAKWHF